MTTTNTLQQQLGLTGIACPRRRHWLIKMMFCIIIMILTLHQLVQIQQYWRFIAKVGTVEMANATISQQTTTTTFVDAASTSSSRQHTNQGTKNISTTTEISDDQFPVIRDINKSVATSPGRIGSKLSSTTTIASKIDTANITCDARDVKGNLGYVADPTLFKRKVQEFMIKVTINDNDSVVKNINDNRLNPYWFLMNGYGKSENSSNSNNLGAPNGNDIQGNDEIEEDFVLHGLFLRKESEILTPEYICSFGPGQGIEEPPGYKLMTEKLRVHDKSYEGEDDDRANSTSHKHPKIRILCGVYTYSAKQELVRAHALSWGYECDGWLAFSNHTIPELGILNLKHDGPESYQNMWQKTRSIWTYIYKHYLDDYDYFHLSGDDTYVIVSNLRYYLESIPIQPQYQPLHLGQLLPNKANMRSGGPGYTLNRAAVRILIEQGLAHPTKCNPNAEASAEDRFISTCFQSILPTNASSRADGRDSETGEQLYHDNHPSTLYTFRSTNNRNKRGASYLSKNAYYWEQLPHPQNASVAVGPKQELEAIAKYSVSFHNIYSPTYVTRFHVILHPNICPKDSPLGIGLRQHRKIQMDI